MHINRKYKELHWRAQSTEAHRGPGKRRKKSVQAAAFLEELCGISANWVKVNLHFKVQLSLNGDTKGRQGTEHLKHFVQRERHFKISNVVKFYEKGFVICNYSSESGDKLLDCVVLKSAASLGEQWLHLKPNQFQFIIYYLKLPPLPYMFSCVLPHIK